MSDERWTWSPQAHPSVQTLLTAPVDDLGWCSQLETAARNATVGKVLCVCATAAIAREVVRRCGAGRSAADALDLLDRWIDDPTNERFARICSLIFDDDSPEMDSHGAVWWALRTSTSSVGNFEAGWALESTAGAAVAAGFTVEQLRAIIAQELLSRTRSGK